MSLINFFLLNIEFFNKSIVITTNVHYRRHKI